MTMVELWSLVGANAAEFARQSREREAAGYDGICKPDSQNLSHECYVTLALAATQTQRIKLAPGVSNPFTRHPAVTASAVATLHAISGGRAELGIGRGDSALAHIGHAPASVQRLRSYVKTVQAYLAGRDVPFHDRSDVQTLHLAHAPASSRIKWLDPESHPKVFVDVAATGPKVIELAAALADGVTFAVGADPARLRWAIDIARHAREQAGLDPGTFRLGAYVNLVVHDQPEIARKLGAGPLTVFTRFSGIHGKVVGPASPELQGAVAGLLNAYDMDSHAQQNSPQAATLTDAFARQFGIFGPPTYCLERIEELTSLGLRRLVVLGPTSGADPQAAEETEMRFQREVIPALWQVSG